MKIKLLKQSPEPKKTNQISDVLSIDNEDVKPKLERIVWFFNDGSFKEYSPGR